MSLAASVETLWFSEKAEPSPRHARERVLPSGTAQVIIPLDDGALAACDPADGAGWRRFRGGVLSGPRSRHHLIATPWTSTLVGIHFKPGGLRPFIDEPAGRFENRHVRLAAVWGRAAIDLRRRLRRRQTVEQRFSAIEDFLLARRTAPFGPPPVVARALELFAKAPDEPRIADVVARSGLAARRFITVFRDHVGLTPKLFCRVLRLQRALHRMSGPRWSWVDVALDSGYCDQSHFNRDFRAFTGLTPRQYDALVGAHRRHVPVAE